MMRFQETVQILAELHNLGLTQERQWLQMTRDDPRHLELRVHNGAWDIGLYLTSPDNVLWDSQSAVLDIQD